MIVQVDTQQFENRKKEHISLALEQQHQASGYSQMDSLHLVHDALPELDWEDIHLQTDALQGSLATPFFIAAMTAGHPDAFRLNLSFAQACEERGWAMGVGSQRRSLEGFYPEEVAFWKKVRQAHPRLELYANIGLSQLIRASHASIKNLVDVLQAAALVVHVNVLQEALQPEGTPRFRGGCDAILQLKKHLAVPIILKETGCGFSLNALKKVQYLPIAALDVSGLGGTHWGRIEGSRAAAHSVYKNASDVFSNWGESTVMSCYWAVQTMPESIQIWASGGVRNGLDAAKMIALGAYRVGYAQPALEALYQERLIPWMADQEHQLKVALFCTGCENTTMLRKNRACIRILGKEDFTNYHNLSASNVL